MRQAIPSPKGFALIVALALMAFILILLLSLSTLLRVEMSTTQVTESSIQARANALLGMQIALGETQVLLGPDQRVSASADILATTDNSAQHWVGAWDADQTSPNFGTNLGWLVSGQTLDPTTGPPGTTIRIAKIDDTGDIANDYLTVPEVEIAEGNGAYAWWVDDEGLKAKLNPAELTGNLSNPESHLQQQTDDLQQLSADLFNTLTVSYPGLQSITDDPPPETLYSNLRNAPGQEALLMLFPDASDPGFNLDHTAYSFGLLTDVKNGGLRKNLTAAFLSDTEYNKLLTDAGKGPDGDLVFGQHDSATSSADDPGGPRWDQLRSYFSMASQVDASSDIPSIDLLAPDPEDRVSAITPLLTQMQLFVSAVYLDRGGNQYEVVYLFFPAVVLWNPYNVSIDAPNLYVRLTNYQYWELGRKGNFDYGFNISVGEQPTPVNRYKNGLEHKVNGTGLNPDSFRFVIGGTSFKPGEARIFTPSATTVLDLNTANNNVLADGYFSGHGFYHETDVITTIDPSSNDKHWLQLGGRQLYNFHWQLSTNPLFTTESILHSVKDLTAYGTWGPNNNGESGQENWIVSFPDPFEPLVFNSLDPTTIIPLDNLVYGYKTSLQLKENNTINPLGSSPKQWIAHFNPRGNFSGATPLKVPNPGNPDKETNESNTSYVSGVPNSGTSDVSDWAVINESPAFDSKTAGIGYSDTTASNIRSVLFEVPHPDVPFQSIGQLGMTNLSRSNNYDNYPSDNHRRYVYTNLQPAFPLGNSLASAFIPKGITSTTWDTLAKVKNSNVTGAVHDYSYQLNNALWDKFFFTSENIVGLESNLGNEVIFPLTNPRLLPAEGSLTYADLRDYDTTAGSLMVEGAFNINSTNVNAWKSLLGSFFGQSLKYSNLGSGGNLTEADNDDSSPFARFAVPSGDVSTTSANSFDDSVYIGYRRLDETEIDTLATEIVEELKDRRGTDGPYLSLADFINRNPSSSDANYQLRGLLQSAINDAGLNSHLEGGSNETGNIAPAYPADQVAGSLITGAPGYLMQADLLNKLSTVMTVRSDTFRIRSYGKVNDPITGDPVAEAWCEAIVQRMPERMDGDTAIPIYADTDRRFAITAFRWLSEDEL